MMEKGQRGVVEFSLSCIRCDCNLDRLATVASSQTLGQEHAVGLNSADARCEIMRVDQDLHCLSLHKTLRHDDEEKSIHYFMTRAFFNLACQRNRSDTALMLSDGAHDDIRRRAASPIRAIALAK